MEEVIRVREVRKSMEQSGFFFTPACSPAAESTANVSRFYKTNGKASTPHNMNDPYMTLDVSSSISSSSSPEEETESFNRNKSPLRKKPKESAAAVTPSSRALRNRVLQDSSTSLDSSAVAELSATPEGIQRRIVPKRKINFTNV